MMDSKSHNSGPTVHPSLMPAQLCYVLHNLIPEETAFNKDEKLSTIIRMTDPTCHSESSQLLVSSSEDTLQKVFIRKTLSDFTKVLFIVSVDLLVFAFVWLLSYTAALQIFCGLLGVLLYTMFLAMDYLSEQLTMAKQTHALNFEDYIFFALHIFIDIVIIFLYVLSIFFGISRY